MIFEQFKRVALVACVFVAVLEWQNVREAEAEKGAVRWVTELLDQWNSARDLDTREKLQAEIEDQTKEIRDPANIVRALKPEYLDTFVANEAMQEWWNKNPAGLLAWMGAQQPPPKFQAIHYLSKLADDPDAERQYMQTLAPGPWKEKVLGTLAQKDMLAGMPQAAIGLIEQMPQSDRPPLLQSAIFEWAQRDPDGAVDWVNCVPAAGSRRDFILPTVMGWAVNYPKDALQWLFQSGSPGPTTIAAVRQVIAKWVKELTPADGAAWVQQLPPGKIRDAALDELINQWSEIDPPAVARWTAGLPQKGLSADAARILNSRAGGNGLTSRQYLNP